MWMEINSKIGRFWLKNWYPEEPRRAIGARRYNSCECLATILEFSAVDELPNFVVIFSGKTPSSNTYF